MTKNLDLTITPKMVQEYEFGTLSGWLDQTGQGLWFEKIAEKIEATTGKATQRQRGVIVWPRNQRGW